MEDQSATAWKDTVRKKSKVFYFNKKNFLEKSSCVVKININIPGTYFLLFFIILGKIFCTCTYLCIIGEVVTKCTVGVAVKFTKSLQKARHIFPTELYSIS
jgi:hypothetical protein